MEGRALVVTFVRLKLALVRNGVRQSTGRSAAFVGTMAVVALFGVLGLLGLVALRGHGNAADVAVLLVALLALGWAFMPLFVGGADETLDPGRLAMLPLRPGALLVAQLAASLVGPGPLFTLLLVAGAVAAVAGGGAGIVVAVVAVALALLVCTTLARALATANARLLNSRRGRDLAILSGLVVAFGLQGINLGFSELAGDENGDFGVVATVADVVRWVPPATAIEAARAAGEGAWGTAALALAGTLAAWGLLLVWWGRALTRLMTAPDASTLRTPPDDGGRRARDLAWLPRGRTGTVMARTLRYAWRDPKSKMGWVTSLGMGLMLPVLFAAQGNASLYNACWVSGLLGILAYNQFGGDAGGFWLVALTISSPRDALIELRGRTLVIALIGVPYTCAVVVVSAAVFDDWGALPGALGLALTVLGALLGVGAVTSARLPYSVPQEGAMKNVAPGQTGQAWFGILGGTVAGGLLSAPVIALVVWLNASAEALTWTALPLGAAYGLLVAWLGLRVAAPMTAGRLPEMVGALSK
ncbi:transporter [Streptomyces radicis]|uniref:Transporter n=1 Tax=Streptomyces radicis TaxID=1750517 RepID=A0A3A9WPX9_9ACTN|nr:transporter [Streptomyces radicis]RKN23453.1 transporter [Streptomyces radicis]